MFASLYRHVVCRLPSKIAGLTPAQGEAYDLARTPESNRRASWNHRIRDHGWI